MDSKLSAYRALLVQLQELFGMYSEKKWADRLSGWIKDLDSARDYKPHLERTFKALSGMGSMGDVVVCPENGHVVSGGEEAIAKANEQIKEIILKLDREIAKF